MRTDEALWCVVPAAGHGRRFGSEVPKQYMPLAGQPLILRTLERLAAHPRIAGLMVVLAEGDTAWAGIDTMDGKPVLTTLGGAERADSVLAGLRALPGDVSADAFVLVHDAARPCVRAADIEHLVVRASVGEGGLLGAPLRDTLKHADAGGHSCGTEPRDGRWRAFTPQMFRRGALSDALTQALADGVAITDEAMAMERAGMTPLLVEGSEDNIKVTTRADLALAEFLLPRTR
ncbi:MULTISPECIES: 2-C-methyl-D-erythritol 4-phosphate cytidylyltransferase [Oleiagrimonas]|jgi:2-C-methyl-D-erythritol 4-phosphate cytidylyltransferase|uniref:2-C-methyl-D-erythritol 4-phosphate cytidylyltransferase n=1 Tax=Oleiagrimonas citrea TaxID=1665687 RepID=A0A846ZNF3_9GAMM|nr:MULTISPECIES: 2-C-methyl-D-erythritol 4-phosphate cytidylyltransferase [Oleiagrimonas]NKZ39090.1 2-C-methyl-D-erythritol 4-phosphate cytidylyltransferase [Oleiagrimonas citrea]RAP57696.1 2-C-methyl-D-erythritol 4-phosphate cytidylyltransferase [Oleiagrimonas sp. MCCC 1A03011]